jgi:hypothetical protein
MTPLKNNGLIDYNKYSRQKRYTRQGKPWETVGTVLMTRETVGTVLLAKKAGRTVHS